MNTTMIGGLLGAALTFVLPVYAAPPIKVMLDPTVTSTIPGGAAVSTRQRLSRWASAAGVDPIRIMKP